VNAARSFKNKTVLITGASGFIGHALASSLSSTACTIIRASRNKNRLAPLKGLADVQDYELDYRAADVWQDLLGGVDIVFFLGAQTSAKKADADPEQDFIDNVRPLFTLLEHCRKSGSKPTIVFASTATVVGLAEQLPVAEGIYENPVTVYDIHKLSCEKYLSYYAGMDYVESCSLRLANVYGPGTTSGSSDRGILNQMIRRAAMGESLSLYGEGLQLRDYTYISDVVAAFEAAALQIENTNARYFNIGSGMGHNLAEAFGEIVSIAKASLGTAIEVERVASPSATSPIETRNYVADTSSFTKATGWSAEVELRDGIKKTLEFYLS